MSRAMQEVESFSPHTLSCQCIELGSGSAIRELCQFQLNVSLENQGLDMFHFLCHWSQGYGAGNIRGSILILGARIQEQKSLRFQRCIRFG